MPGRLRRAARPAIGSACVLALALSFVVARAGGEPQADDPVLPAIPQTTPAAATTTSLLGRAHDLPALAPARPKPAKRKPQAAETPARPSAATAPAPAPAAPAPPSEPAYTPPVPVTPAQPVPEPAPQPSPESAPAQPDPPPPVYFDDSG
jgi:hypothetical protein